MKKSSNILCCVLAIMLALSIGGCSEKEPTAGENEVPALIWLIPGDKQPDVASVAEAAGEILEREVGAKLDIQFIDTAAYNERMTMNMASGTYFDLCFTGYINPYVQAVQKGGYLDITDYLKNSTLIDEIPAFALELVTVDGRIYGIPNMQTMVGCTGLYVQKDLAEEFGLKTEDIKCLNDIEPFLKWVKDNKQGIWPFRAGNYYAGGIKGGNNSGDVYLDTINEILVSKNADGSLSYKPYLESEYFLKEPELMRDWFMKGYIRSDVASVTNDSQELNAGKFAAWRGAYKPGGEEEYNNAQKTQVICIQLTKPWIGTGGVSAMTGVGRNTKYPEKVIKTLEMVNTDKALYNLISYGIEGKHYALDADNRINYIADSGYAPKANWKFGSVFNSLLLPGQSDTVWEDTKAFNESAVRTPLMGFVFDTTPVRTEIAQITTVKGRYKSLFTGAENIDSYIDKYKNEMEAAGIRRVAEEIETQSSEWLAKKAQN